MEPSLQDLPADVLRIILHCGQQPFALGVLGRVCRNLYATINLLEDEWIRLASITPELDTFHAESSAEKSKVAASRLKLNRFAALVKRIKRSEANVVSIRDSGRVYIPEARKAPAPPRAKTKIVSENEEDAEDEDGEAHCDYDDDDYDYESYYGYNVLHNAGSKKFTVITTEEDGGSSWTSTYTIGVVQHDVNDPIDSRVDLDKNNISVDSQRFSMIADQYWLTWDRPTDEGTCWGIYDQATQKSDIFEPAGTEPAVIPNRHVDYPWVLLHRIDIVKIPREQGSSGRGRGGGRGRGRGGWRISREDDEMDEDEDGEVQDEEERHLTSVYDLRQQKFLATDLPLCIESWSDVGAVFFKEYLIDPVHWNDEEESTSIACYVIDIVTGTLRRLWVMPFDATILDVDDINVSILIDRSRLAKIRLTDGRILFDRQLDVVHVDDEYRSFHRDVKGRFLLYEKAVYDLFDLERPIFRVPEASSISFLDSSHWIAIGRSSCYMIDFESPFKEVETEITCCCLGVAQFETGPRGSHQVSCKATYVDVPVNTLFASAAKLLGCTTAEVSCQKMTNYDQEYARVEFCSDNSLDEANFYSPFLSYIAIRRSDGAKASNEKKEMNYIVAVSPGTGSARRPIIKISSEFIKAAIDYSDVVWDGMRYPAEPVEAKPLSSINEVFDSVLIKAQTMIQCVKPFDVFQHLGMVAKRGNRVATNADGVVL